MATKPKPPDPSLARVMLQVYGEFGLNQPGEAARAAEIVAEEDPSASTFLTLARYAAMAGDERKADLAGKRAIALAPKQQKDVVEKQVKQIEAVAKAGGAQAAGAGTAPGGAAGAPGGAGGR
jgi:hypothetical protein